jgi:hypothetical protein
MDAVRLAADRAILSMLAADIDAVTVLAPAELSQPLRNMAPGLPLPAFADLPLPLAIGSYLLDRAGWSGPRRSATVTASGQPVPPLDDAAVRTALLIMGDGSARRGEKAPGYLDLRAAPFDDAVATALGAADTEALAALDTDLAGELLVAGVGPWKLLGGLGGSWQAELLYAGDPFGVAYFVAAWTLT